MLSLNEKLEGEFNISHLNEAKFEDWEKGIKMEEMYDKSPWERRTFLAKFLRDLVRGISPESKAVIKDLDETNAPEYIEFIYKKYFKSNIKANTKLQPLRRIAEGLKDYSKEKIDGHNRIFEQVSKKTYDEVTKKVTEKNTTLGQYIASSTDDNDWVILSIYIFEEDFREFGIELSLDEVVSILDSIIKPLTDDFDIEKGSPRRGDIIITGTTKEYNKKVKAFDKKLIAKIKSNND